MSSYRRPAPIPGFDDLFRSLASIPGEIAVVEVLWPADPLVADSCGQRACRLRTGPDVSMYGGGAGGEGGIDI